MAPQQFAAVFEHPQAYARKANGNLRRVMEGAGSISIATIIWPSVHEKGFSASSPACIWRDPEWNKLDLLTPPKN